MDKSARKIRPQQTKESGDSLGSRMKLYEDSWRIKLPPRMPIIIRVDGKAFHSIKAAKPFDDELMLAMDNVAIRLVEEVQGAQFAYVQSDEVSILVHYYKKFNSSAWFDNNLQKIASVSAAIATRSFNEAISAAYAATNADPTVVRWLGCGNQLFDARVFALPEDEVNNYFVWRQQDWARNSVQMFARSVYSHNELNGKNTAEMHEMLHQKGLNWSQLDGKYKNGRTAMKYIDGDVECVEAVSFKEDRNFTKYYMAREEG